MRNHLQSHHIPSDPKPVPFLEGWDVSWQWLLLPLIRCSGVRDMKTGGMRERREDKLGAFNNVQGRFSRVKREGKDGAE